MSSALICSKRSKPASVLALGFAALLAGCSASSEDRLELGVASSLAVAMERLTDEFETETGISTILVVAGSGTLLTQLEAGAGFDGMAVADQDSLERVLAFRPGATHTRFATGRVVLAVAKDNPRRLSGLSSLSDPELRTAIGTEGSPIGRYSRQVLAQAEVVIPNPALETSAAAIVSKLLLGEIDAGLVYHTDVVASGGLLTELAIPDAPSQFFLARWSAPAAQFQEFLVSAPAAAILSEFGFGPP